MSYSFRLEDEDVVIYEVSWTKEDLELDRVSCKDRANAVKLHRILDNYEYILLGNIEE